MLVVGFRFACVRAGPVHTVTLNVRIKVELSGQIPENYWILLCTV